MEQLFSIEIDVNNLALKSKVKILENNLKLNGTLIYEGLFKYETSNKYRFSISKDNKNLLISYQIKASNLELNDREYKTRFGIYKFDEGLNKTGAIYNMQSSNLLANYLDFLITNNNEVYILSEIYDNEERHHYVGKNKNYHLELLQLKNEEIINVKLNEKDYFIRDLKLSEGINNEVIVAGYYLNGGYLTDVNGIFYCNLLKDELRTSYTKIPVELINLYENEKSQKKNFKLLSKGKLGFSNLKLNSLEIDSLGEIVIIGEQFYSKETLIGTPGNGNYSGRVYQYYYKDLFVTKLSNSGNLLWMNKIPKNQYADLLQLFIFYRKKHSVRNLSYSQIRKEDKLFFIYWDKSQNLDLAVNENPDEYVDEEWAKLFCTELDYITGKLNKKIIFKPIEYMSDKPNARFNYFRMPIKDLVFTKKGIFMELKDFGNNSSDENMGIQIEL